jgi:two-component system chemotaxis response regulator CheY
MKLETKDMGRTFAATASTEGRMRRTVMVVDDSQTVRQTVSMVLTAAGFDVIEGVDGIDAMEKLRQTPGVALVFCDVNMPRMNGLEMLETMRQDPTVAGTPVVMLTSEGQASLVARAKDSGAKGWIVKPFKPEFLLAAVKKLARAAA